MPFALLQWRGLRWGSRARELSGALKAVGFRALVVACSALGGTSPSVAAGPPAHAPAGLALAVAVVLALQAVIYTYDGWDAVIYFCEEVRNPAHDIPRSMFGSVLSITAIYLLLNAALVYVLPISVIGGGKFSLGGGAPQNFGGHRGPNILRVMGVSVLRGRNTDPPTAYPGRLAARL